MSYRIKVIEYESGRKEYVPQVRRRWWNVWKYIWGGEAWRFYNEVFKCNSPDEAATAIKKYKEGTCQSTIKSTTYKSVQP